MEPVTANKALFIKLGEGGRWESECLKAGTLRFGYQEIPHEACVSGNWSEVERTARGFSPFYFVTHSPNEALRNEAMAADNPAFILWDVERLAAQAVRGGLTGWLLDKAA